MFQLTSEEYEYLRSHFATSSEGNAHGGRRYMPYAFTEQGIAMLSAVLKEPLIKARSGLVPKVGHIII